jgi:hypothetical protein
MAKFGQTWRSLKTLYHRFGYGCTLYQSYKPRIHPHTRQPALTHASGLYRSPVPDIETAVYPYRPHHSHISYVGRATCTSLTLINSQWPEIMEKYHLSSLFDPTGLRLHANPPSCQGMSDLICAAWLQDVGHMIVTQHKLGEEHNPLLGLPHSVEGLAYRCVLRWGFSSVVAQLVSERPKYINYNYLRDLKPSQRTTADQEWMAQVEKNSRHALHQQLFVASMFPMSVVDTLHKQQDEYIDLAMESVKQFVMDSFFKNKANRA